MREAECRYAGDGDDDDDGVGTSRSSTMNQETTPGNSSVAGSIASSGGLSRQSSALSSSQNVPPVFQADRRLLELQLMSRWSAVTYKSCCTPGADDDEVWQKQVPAMGLRFDFLLNGLLALTAFDSARLSEDGYRAYVTAGAEYQAVALGSFRQQLPFMTEDSHEVVFCFSLMLMVLALVSAQYTPASDPGEPGSMLQNTMMLFEMIRGCVTVAESKVGYLAENPYIARLKRFENLPLVPLDPEIEKAMTKLSELNDGRIKTSAHHSDELRMQQITYWEACKKALVELKDCFGKCRGPEYQGYALAWMNMAGDEYVQAIKDGDETALLAMMFWGVLVERVGHLAWWAQGFGGRLIQDLSTLVVREETSELVRDIVSRAQELVRIEVSKRVVMG